MKQNNKLSCTSHERTINNSTGKNCIKKILSLDWNIASDEFIIYFTDIINTTSNLHVTKRNVLKLAFRPIGTNISQIIQIKVDRYSFTNQHSFVDFELHGFYHASTEAYSASVNR